MSEVCLIKHCVRPGARNGKDAFCRYHIHRLRDFTCKIGQTELLVSKLIEAFKTQGESPTRSAVILECERYLSLLPPDHQVKVPTVRQSEDDSDPDSWMVDDGDDL